nr:C69 family dipeptidase [uncultured Roseateles sp.]
MCTVIAVGRLASADGSTLLSHSDTGRDSRIRKVPAADHAPGAKAPVHFGIQDSFSADLAHYGEVIGEIEQVAHTYAYFHSAYSHINEHQLAIVESTTSQRPELRCLRGEGEQIMTIEQAMVFALQRCRHPREAIALIGELMERYGFLCSCGEGSELLCIGDTEEIWVMEVLGVGKGWTRASGEPGAIWAARRMPDDHVMVAANWSVLRELNQGDLKLDDSEDTLACAHVERFAAERGWFDPQAGRPFDWQEAYIPLPREWATARLWLFYSQVAPSLRAWPERQLGENRYRTLDAYSQVVEPLSIYPLSVRPEKPLSLQDLMAFHRSTFEQTIYDISEQPQWYVMNEQGGLEKSPLATPFPTPELRRLLKLTPRRTVARHFGFYAVICQLRRGLPEDMAGVYWVALHNPHVSTWLPCPIGTLSMPASFCEYDPEQYSDTSARWCIDFVDNLMQLAYQKALPLLKAIRDPYEAELHARWQALDAQLQAMTAPHDQPQRQQLITEFVLREGAAIPGLYIGIRNRLIVALTHTRNS